MEIKPESTGSASSKLNIIVKINGVKDNAIYLSHLNERFVNVLDPKLKKRAHIVSNLNVSVYLQIIRTVSLDVFIQITSAMIMTIFAAIAAGIMFSIEVSAAAYAGSYNYNYYYNSYYSPSYLSNRYTRSNEQVTCKLCFTVYKFISATFALHGTVNTEIITQ